MGINRRTALGALAILPVTCAAPLTASIASETSPAHRASWDDLMGRYEAAQTAADAEEIVWRQAHAKYQQLCGSEPDTRLLAGHELWLLRTADLDALAQDAREAGPPFSDARLQQIEGIRDWRGRRDRANQATSYDEVANRFDDLTNEASDLQSALMRTPAPDAAALHWKLAYFLNTEGGSLQPYTATYVAQTQADVRRLLGGEAAR